MDSAQQLTGALLLPVSEQPPKPKSLEETVREELGVKDAVLAMRICDRLATEGRPLGEIAADVLGTWDANADREERRKRAHAGKVWFYSRKNRCTSLAAMYARAKASRADVLFDEIVEIADEPLSDPHPLAVKAEVEARKLRVEARKWAAGKMNRGLYGDDPPNQSGVNVTINSDGGASVLEEIQRRIERKRQARLEQERNDQASASATSAVQS